MPSKILDVLQTEGHTIALIRGRSQVLPGYHLKKKDGSKWLVTGVGMMSPGAAQKGYADVSIRSLTAGSNLNEGDDVEVVRN